MNKNHTFHSNWKSWLRQA